MAVQREQFLVPDGTVDVHHGSVGHGEHVAGVTEPRRAAVDPFERLTHHQPVHAGHRGERDAAVERHQRVQPGRVQRHVHHVLLVPLGQQQPALVVVPQLHGVVRLAARNEHRHPVADGQAAHASRVQSRAERFDEHLEHGTDEWRRACQ